MNLKAMMEDQRTFNEQVWPTDQPRTQDEIHDRHRELGIGMVEELAEFHRALRLKKHRKIAGLENVAQTHIELIDMLKYWMSMAELVGLHPNMVEEVYYAKSRVVQYRYQEEWMLKIDRPCVIIDIDMVLADYITGMCDWIRAHLINFSSIPTEIKRIRDRLEIIQRDYLWIDAESLGISSELHSRIKHSFRSQGGWSGLPVFPDAKPFLEWCKSNMWQVVLLTSRSMDRYPNIFADTLSWLHMHQLPFDLLWWANDKARRLEEYEHVNLRAHTVFAIDDDMRFVQQFRSKGVRTYRMHRGPGIVEDELWVRNLHEVILSPIMQPLDKFVEHPFGKNF